MNRLRIATAFTLATLPVFAQGTLADYQRAATMRETWPKLATGVPEPAVWTTGNKFVYRRSVAGGGHEFVMADGATGAKQPAFDHARLARFLSEAGGKPCTATTLPFSTFDWLDANASIRFTADGTIWKTSLSDYATVKDSTAPPPRGNGVGQSPRPPVSEMFNKPVASPDGKLEAVILNCNLWLREKGGKASAVTFDGNEANYYDLRSIAWSPDSRKLALYRIRPGQHRMVTWEESSPADQVQPKYFSLEYAKPGDTLDLQQPVLVDAGSHDVFPIDNSLFPSPYALSRAVWQKDSRAFTFEYNQRGHQAYRVIEVDAASGHARAIIDEQPKTFFTYSSKKYRHDTPDAKEMIWMSERDGWNHLYLFDTATGKVKNQITKGNWVVRGVDFVDDATRRIWFHSSGMHSGKDPYFNYYFRINFDGTGLTSLTDGEGNHAAVFSPDGQYFVDIWSRVDQAPVSELRAADGRKIAELERADIAPLKAAGWSAPEVFTAMGRDGKTDIWGIILRPTNFDPAKKYPVIEYIYAGPHDSFVPKSFFAWNAMQGMAELGFIVVQIDGMGTSNRSKAFHDVAWKNLQDAGFPDRILWHQALAAKYPWYDATRTGIYGNSAGGQNALGALLFHPEFYKTAVSTSGCHDNRMDKIWWNEQWMGWPLGPQYVAASNVENAGRLKGKLLLTVGELDDNVDPASTMQVVNALVKANKNFDFMFYPGLKHSPGGEYGERKRFDFFVRNLLGLDPPDWNGE